MKKQTSFSLNSYALILMMILGLHFQNYACPIPSTLTLNYTFTTATAGQTVEVTWVSDCPATLMEITLVNVPLWTGQQFYANIPNTGSYFFAINSSIIPGETLFFIRDMGNNIWNYGPSFELMAPLPIELIDFKGNLEKDNAIQLNWITASELNNSGFEIERSVNGDDWSEIGFVEGRGTSTVTNHYEFIDSTANSGNNYYRLKQIDFDGQFEYSKIAQVKVPPDQVYFRISPNPTSDILYISFDQPLEEKINIDLVRLDGQIIRHQKLSTGEAQCAIDCHHLSMGIYFLKVQRDGIPFQIEKVIIQ